MTSIRAVILSLLPTWQLQNAKKKVDKVVEEVLSYAKPLLPCSRTEDFRLALTQVCQRICEQWMELHRIQEKIEPSMEPSVGDWEAFQLRLTKNGDAKDNQATGTSKTSSKAKNQLPQPLVEQRNIHCTV